MATVWSLSKEQKGFPERPGKLYRTEVTEELAPRIRAALDEWVVRMSYTVTYEDEDGDEHTASDDIRYKDIRDEHIVLYEGVPVGVLLEEIVYYHNSNVTDTNLYVLYFRDAPDHDLMLEGARSGRNYVEGTCYFSLRRRDEIPNGAKRETANSEFFPVPKVYC